MMSLGDERARPSLRQAVKEFRDNGLKVTFLNTPFFKITLPGTEPLLRRPERRGLPIHPLHQLAELAASKEQRSPSRFQLTIEVQPRL